MKKLLAIIGIKIWMLTAMATIFVPIPLEEQLREASGAVHGIFVSSVSKKLANGEVVTENTFKLINKSGISAGEIINKQNFKVLSPGGVWQGLVYHVEGAPTFEKGEEVILLLQKGKFGLEVYGLGMGKYNLKTEDRETTIFSSIFPHHKNLGNIKVEEFNLLLNKVYGEPFQRLKGKHFVQQKVEMKRGVASRGLSSRNLSSLSDEEENDEGTSAPLGGVIFFLLMAIGIVYFFNKT